MLRVAILSKLHVEPSHVWFQHGWSTVIQLLQKKIETVHEKYLKKMCKYCLHRFQIKKHATWEFHNARFSKRHDQTFNHLDTSNNFFAFVGQSVMQCTTSALPQGRPSICLSSRIAWPAIPGTQFWWGELKRMTIDKTWTVMLCVHCGRFWINTKFGPPVWKPEGLFIWSRVTRLGE